MIITKVVCLLAATVASVVFLIQASMLLHHVDQQIAPLSQSTQQTISNANAILIRAATTEDKLNDAADKQSVYWEKGTRESLKILAATKEVLVRTDLNLNGGPGSKGTLPTLTATLVDTDKLVNGTTVKVADTLDGLKPTLTNLATASNAAAQVMSDPHIPQAVAHLDETSLQVEGIATDAHTETGLIVQQTRKAFQPKNKFLALSQYFFSGTVNAASLYYFLTH